MANHQVVWITGASSGIGAALARAYAKAGAALILSGRRRDALEAVARDCGAHVQTLILPFEALDFETLPSFVAQALAWKNRIDILVNNAGISQRSLAVDTDFSVYKQIVDVDLMAPIRLSQLVLPHMLAQQSGHLVQIASIAGKVGVPLRTAYCAAKHGLIGYSDALRAEVAALGVKVTVVTPGYVRTNIAMNALTADGERQGHSDDHIDAGLDPDDVAQTIVAAVAHGTPEVAMGGRQELLAVKLRRFLPNFLFRQTQKMGALAIKQVKQNKG